MGYSIIIISDAPTHSRACHRALNETGVYVSPLTDEVIAKIEADLDALKKTSGINGIATEDADTIYFDLNGQQIQKPATGKMVIKVQNGKASKVLVK